MIGQADGHGWGALFPLATIGPDLRQLDLQSAMRSDEVEEGIFQVELPLQEPFLFGMRQGFANQPSITLARSQIVPFDIRGVDL